MKTRGFTMLELIAVILILGVVTLITVPTVNKIIENSKKNLLNEQIERIEKTAKTYMAEQMEIDPSNANASYLINIKDMQDKGYLSNDDILNPLSEEEMDGCVIVKHINATDKYEYEYNDECPFENKYDGADKVLEFYTSDVFEQSPLITNATSAEKEDYDLDLSSKGYTTDTGLGIVYNGENPITAYMVNVTKMDNYNNFKYAYDKLKEQADMQNKVVLYSINTYTIYVMSMEVPAEQMSQVLLELDAFYEEFNNISCEECAAGIMLETIYIDN